MEKSLKRWIAAIAAGLLVAALQVYASVQLKASLSKAAVFALPLGAMMAAALVLRAELRSWWSILLQQIGTAVAGVFFLHYVLMDGIKPLVPVIINNVLLSLALQLLLVAIVGRPRAVGLGWLIFCWGFSMVDCALVQFRGSVIVLNDLFSLQTALNVAGSYRFAIWPRMITSACVFLIAAAVIVRCPVQRGLGSRWRFRGLAVLLSVLSGFYPVLQLRGMEAHYWGKESVYFNGVLMEYALELQDLHVSRPENYSEQLEALTAAYPVEAENTQEEEPPHVIAIMFEALSDLAAVSDLETSEDVMPFCHGFEEETVHGYALSSVLGGGTATSEWEFLTGNTNAFLPGGSIAYRQYVRGEANSIAKVFQSSGYQCIAVHPYRPNGWDRERVYPLLGFEEFYSLDDLDWDETVRKKVSDGAFVRQIIDLFENRDPEKPMFLFGVSMQNHSSYAYEDFESTVQVKGMEGEYPCAEQYLSLVQLTDAAIEELITYLRDCDEKVVVVMFGDHQPQLEDGFDAAVGLSAANKYLVPYYIWKNYGTESAENSPISLNYLPAMLLDAVGLQKPPYYQFLSDVQQVVPAISAVGCVTADGGNTALKEVDGAALEALNQYRVLQHANLFDGDADDAFFIGAAGSIE
ncbi:MAG: LTA synthase family protein [Candidatus Faecivicinus sp.]